MTIHTYIQLTCIVGHPRPRPPHPPRPHPRPPLRSQQASIPCHHQSLARTSSPIHQPLARIGFPDHPRSPQMWLNVSARVKQARSQLNANISEKQRVPTQPAHEASVTEQYTYIHPIACSEMRACTHSLSIWHAETHSTDSCRPCSMTNSFTAPLTAPLLIVPSMHVALTEGKGDMTTTTTDPRCGHHRQVMADAGRSWLHYHRQDP